MDEGIADQEVSRSQIWEPGRPGSVVMSSNYHCLKEYHVPSNRYTFTFTPVPAVPWMSKCILRTMNNLPRDPE